MNRSKFIRLAFVGSLVPPLTGAASDGAKQTLEKQKNGKDKKKDWIQLFNGRDLSGWTPKIRYEQL